MVHAACFPGGYGGLILNVNQLNMSSGYPKGPGISNVLILSRFHHFMSAAHLIGLNFN